MLSTFNNYPVDSVVKQNIITGFIAILTAALIIMTCSLLINVSAKIRIDSVNHILKKQIEMQIEHYEKLERLNNDIRRFKHDYINHLTSISTLIGAKLYSDAEDYIQKLTSSNYSGNVLFHTGNRLADAILTDKSDTCQEFADIEFNGYISENIDNADICTIFANALDNAIEACKKCPQKGTISIAAQERQGYQAISMRNPTIASNAVGIMKTTKEDVQNHGLGLLSIEQTVKKYDGDMETKIENGVFEISVTMKL
ncbi:MAG: GHKL domain-containing protein [Oscillospiraceae bacterium]|nr:GHKL domain-containing protein [Oscillospiraceae bacterium]